MCVICYSPKGVDAPTEEQIEDMFRANPDGAGFAYEEGNKVVYKKGFMNLNALLLELAPLEQWKNKNLAIHFRIGTAGNNDEHTCHPFPITTSYGEMRKTEGEGPVLFHNGILANGGWINEHSSDTQDFVSAFAPMLKKYSKSKARDQWIEKIIGTSKLLLMYGKNKVKMYGDWKKDGELYVSNLNYKVQSYSTYSCYGNYYGGYSDYWEKRDREKNLIKQTAKKLFDKLKRDEYIWATENEIECMLEDADSYTYCELEKDGRKYGYDFNACCVWTDDALY